jgi:hypothetical protein
MHSNAPRLIEGQHTSGVSLIEKLKQPQPCVVSANLLG